MKPPIAISIVIPAYNEEQLIGKCLLSLVQQEFNLPYEIIVVNNNSTDTTVSIAQSFGVKIVSEANQGVIWARQRGLSQAQGEIVAQADADCIYPENWLSSIYKHFQNPQVVAVGGPTQIIPPPIWAILYFNYLFKCVLFIYKLNGKALYLPAHNFVFRKNIFLGLGGYRTYLDCGGDEIDIIKRLQKVGKIIYLSNNNVASHGRRYQVGFFKWFSIHLLYYYYLSYFLSTVFKKSFIHAKAIRTYN